MRVSRILRLCQRSHFLFVGAALLLAAPLTAMAASPQDFYAGKRMTILIGFTPAGGHDLEARIMARHLPRHMPGLSSVVVQNMPGAGGLMMGAHIYKRAAPDGLTTAVFGGTHLQSAILGEGVEYDVSKMSVVWSVSGIRVGLVRDFLGAKSALELTKVPADKIIVSGRTKTDSSCLMGNLAMELLGVKGHKSVCAYAGTAVIKAAMERGEVSYFNASDAHLVGGGAYVEMFQKGQVIPLWQSGLLGPDGKISRSPTVREDVPTFYEAHMQVHNKPPLGPLWDAFRILDNVVHGNLTRVLIMPPGTPADRIEYLRTSIANMAKDPAFVRDWEKVFGQKLAPVLVSAKEAEAMKDDFMRPAPWQDHLRKFLGF
jgi:tripartite-type tricarboxylate transporter receptor subunit TctC